MADVTVDSDEDEAAQLVEDAATGAIDVPQIATWLAAHLVRFAA